jgi:hypothetical protein
MVVDLPSYGFMHMYLAPLYYNSTLDPLVSYFTMLWTGRTISLISFPSLDKKSD